LNGLEQGKADIFKGDIKYKIITEQDDIIYTDVVSDPTIWHYDYLDDKGKLRGGIIQQDSALFSVKAPYTTSTKSIEFYRVFSADQLTQEENVGSIDLSKLQNQSEIIIYEASVTNYDYEVTKIVDNGDPADKIDVVVMGDGYTTSGIATTYYNNVNQFITGFNATAPFGTYQDAFNIWRVDVVSSQSGADHPCQQIYKNTALNASYGSCSIPRLLSADSYLVYQAAEQVVQAGGEYDEIIVLVNDAEYGGSGGAYAVYAAGYYLSQTAIDVALHEFGHSMGNLEDEYSDPSFAYFIMVQTV
jgi:hypothetical protein